MSEPKDTGGVRNALEVVSDGDGGRETREKRADAKDEGNTPHLMGMSDVCELYGAI